MSIEKVSTYVQLSATLMGAVVVVWSVSFRAADIERETKEQAPRLERIEHQLAKLDRKMTALNAALVQSGTLRYPIHNSVYEQKEARLSPGFEVHKEYEKEMESAYLVAISAKNSASQSQKIHLKREPWRFVENRKPRFGS